MKRSNATPSAPPAAGIPPLERHDLRFPSILRTDADMRALDEHLNARRLAQGGTVFTRPEPPRGDVLLNVRGVAFAIAFTVLVFVIGMTVGGAGGH
jgi:hypothetical protein